MIEAVLASAGHTSEVPQPFYPLNPGPFPPFALSFMLKPAALLRKMEEEGGQAGIVLNIF